MFLIIRYVRNINDFGQFPESNSWEKDMRKTRAAKNRDKADEFDDEMKRKEISVLQKRLEHFCEILEKDNLSDELFPLDTGENKDGSGLQEDPDFNPDEAHDNKKLAKGEKFPSLPEILLTERSQPGEPCFLSSFCWTESANINIFKHKKVEEVSGTEKKEQAMNLDIKPFSFPYSVISFKDAKYKHPKSGNTIADKIEFNLVDETPPHWSKVNGHTPYFDALRLVAKKNVENILTSFYTKTKEKIETTCRPTGGLSSKCSFIFTICGENIGSELWK